MSLKTRLAVVSAVLVILVACRAGDGGRGSPAESPAEATIPPSGPAPRPAEDRAVEGWAIIAEKDDYGDVGMTSLAVGYINTERMRHLLLGAGWEIDHIRVLPEFDRHSLEEGLAWLAEQADVNDLVLLYLAGHGMYFKKMLNWAEFSGAAWAQIPSHRRLLIMDSCQASDYTGAVAGDPAPYLAVAAVRGDEFGWWGVWEEGLPLIGGVFTHYFAAAFGDPTADTDGDGWVSVQEAALLSQERQRTYMHQVVLAVPEFYQDFPSLPTSSKDSPDFPHVVVDDRIGAPLFIELGAYPSERPVQ